MQMPLYYSDFTLLFYFLLLRRHSITLLLTPLIIVTYSLYYIISVTLLQLHLALLGLIALAMDQQ